MREKALFCGLFGPGPWIDEAEGGWPELGPFPYAHKAAAPWHSLYLAASRPVKLEPGSPRAVRTRGAVDHANTLLIVCRRDDILWHWVRVDHDARTG